MIKEGTFFFTKTLRTHPSIRQRGAEFGAKGHWIGILLGHQSPKTPMPTHNQFFQLVGAIGLVGLDDIEDCLGKEQMEKVIQHVQKKYEEKDDDKART